MFLYLQGNRNKYSISRLDNSISLNLIKNESQYSSDGIPISNFYTHMKNAKKIKLQKKYGIAKSGIGGITAYSGKICQASMGSHWMVIQVTILIKLIKSQI